MILNPNIINRIPVATQVNDVYMGKSNLLSNDKNILKSYSSNKQHHLVAANCGDTQSFSSTTEQGVCYGPQ